MSEENVENIPQGIEAVNQQVARGASARDEALLSMQSAASHP
jgi:hypothetical protein